MATATIGDSHADCASFAVHLFLDDGGPLYRELGFWDALRGASDKMVGRDLAGKRFGALTAHVRATPTIGICKITDEEVELIDVPNGSWFCVCQCGHHTTAKAHELVWGMVTDCGKCEPPVCGVVLQK